MKHHLFTMKVSILLDYKIGFLFVSCLECWAYRGPQRHKHVMLYPKLLPKETCTLISDHFPTVYANWFWKVCHYLRLSKTMIIRVQFDFKNVSKGPAFLWQTNIQTVKYGLNDAKLIKKNELILILYSSTLSDMNFQMILMP